MDDRGKRKDLKQLQRDLKTGLSRRAFVNRLKGLGLGFGAAFMLGLKEAQALGAAELEEGLDLKSSNPAVDRIIHEGQDPGTRAGEAEQRMAAVRYARRYARVYTRYARVYARYARIYARYARVYARYARYARYTRSRPPPR
jgi:hypothetical protein